MVQTPPNTAPVPRANAKDKAFEEERRGRETRSKSIGADPFPPKKPSAGGRRFSLSARFDELSYKASASSKKLKDAIATKKKAIDDKIKSPTFVRLIDRCAFTIGIVLMCVTEAVLLRRPDFMWLWYSIAVFPLLAFRFVAYHKLKFHYFMIDFCYFCNFLLLFYLFGHTKVFGDAPLKTPALFKLVFSACNGPLAFGAVMWQNKLVFHDIDKVTSVFIHLCPPLVTFCMRWYPVGDDFYATCGDECVLTINDYLLNPIYFYIFWQIAYTFKTEVMDRKKFKSDKDMMTSLRWMTLVQPHPVYRWFDKRGYWIARHPAMILTMFQFGYTMLTLLPLPFLFQYFWLHSIFLALVFLIVLWNGATFYFEVFSENYSKRLFSGTKKHDQQGRTVQSFASSTLFFVVTFWLFMYYLKFTL